MSNIMTPDEICRDYRQAKDKKGQIKILADLNCTTKEEIIKVLMDCGEKVELPKTKSKKQQKQDIPESVFNAITDRMEMLNISMKALEEKLDPLKAEYKELALYIGKEVM